MKGLTRCGGSGDLAAVAEYQVLSRVMCPVLPSSAACVVAHSDGLEFHAPSRTCYSTDVTL